MAFDGTDLPLGETGKLGGIHGVFSLGGELVGGAPDMVAYRGHDLPRGVALHQWAMSALPKDVKAAVIAEKIKVE